MNVKFAVDASCIIPLLSAWHDFHVRTARAYESRLAQHQRGMVPAHVLLESFSVLTRMPRRFTP